MLGPKGKSFEEDGAGLVEFEEYPEFPVSDINMKVVSQHKIWSSLNVMFRNTLSTFSKGAIATTPTILRI
jgi:hypothetical protein